MKSVIRQLFLVMSAFCLGGLAHADPGPVESATAVSPPGTAVADGPLMIGKTTRVTVSPLSCSTGADKKAVWLNGMDIGVRAIGCDEQAKLLVFNVTQIGAAATRQTDEAWVTLLRRPFDKSLKDFQRPVKLSIHEDGAVVATGDAALQLLDKPRMVTGVAILLALAGLLLWGSLRSGLLRDSGLPPDGVKAHRSFSLARVQMVWWFAIVFLSYVLLWLINVELPAIPGSALVLIGMAGGTALVAAGIDKDRPPVQSEGFWLDISTDVDGITLPRLQQIAWTGFLGVVFIARVIDDLAMPDFDVNTLALMGVSAGAYLGFKVPEKQTNDKSSITSSPINDDGKSGYSPSES